MNKVKISFSAIAIVFVIGLVSCGGGGDDPTPVVPDGETLNINPASLKQEMVGFGGALTWYCNWVTTSPNKVAMADLMFNDLGIDIIRFKNWYYPDNYPTVKTTDAMSDDNSKLHWDATNELYTLAKNRNANVKILLSSWGPPKALKDNDNSRGGTLKKESNVFVYDAFADYWVDVLDHVPFNPDYISMQNEPTFVSTNWTTCKWNHTETAALPDYIKAFDMVYDKIKNRTYVPKMLGPESQDVPTYSAFANLLKAKAHCGLLGYHPYNINASSTEAQIVTSLQTIGAITGKSNIMTEYSDNLDWYNTALFIHHALVDANSSGYIYWKLAWSTPGSGTDHGMISVASNGTYTVTPFYHLIKHFSKNIDAGYHRVESTIGNSLLYNSAFLSPDGKKLTVVVINTGTPTDDIKIAVAGKTITDISAVQSKSGTGTYYKPLTGLTPTGTVSLPGRSITTIVVDLQ